MIPTHRIGPMPILNRTKESAALIAAFGLVVAELRKSRNLTQAELARRMDVDTSTVAKIETGVHFPRVEPWLEMARVLRTTPDEMLKVAQERADMAEAAPIAVLDADQGALLSAFGSCSAEGKRLVLDHARTTSKVYKPRLR